MDEDFLNIYLREVAMQKKFALLSFENFSKIIKNHGSPLEQFFHLHHFLVHVGNIVKIIYPKNNTKHPNNDFIQKRAKAIQKALQLTKGDFDKKQINIRNDFEHYDERIDEWVQNSQHHNFMDISSFTHDAIKGFDITDMFRNIDQQRMILTFTGLSYDLKYLKNFIEHKIK